MVSGAYAPLWRWLVFCCFSLRPFRGPWSGVTCVCMNKNRHHHYYYHISPLHYFSILIMIVMLLILVSGATLAQHTCQVIERLSYRL
jgi:hypothetical protein